MSVLDESVDTDTREALRKCLTRIGTSVACHAPADQPFDLAALARPDDLDDRWGTPGQRTVFLASDPAVALAELVEAISGGLETLLTDVRDAGTVALADSA